MKFFTLNARYRARPVCTVLLTCAAFWTGILGESVAQEPPTPQGTEDKVQLTLQGDIALSDLIDYVSRRQGIQLLYDEEIRQRRVNLVAPDPIPASSLMEVLQSVLVNEDLVITDGEGGSWKRITTAARMPEVARPSRTEQDLSATGAAVPVTRVFTLKNVKPAKAVELVKPFLSPQGATIVPLDNQGVVIVTDVAEKVRRAAELIEILDSGGISVEVRFVRANSVRAEDLASQLAEILSARARALGKGEETGTGIEVTVDTRLNQLVLIGMGPEVTRAEELLKLLDTKLPTTQRSFTLQYISPKNLDDAVRSILKGRPVASPYQSQQEGNVLIVDSTEDVLTLVERIRIDLDTREAPAAQSPIRFYKIKNVPAQELVETIREVSGQSSAGRPRRRLLNDRRRTTNDLAVPGPNLGPLGLQNQVQLPGMGLQQQLLPVPPAYRDLEQTEQQLRDVVDELAVDIQTQQLETMGIQESEADEGSPASLLQSAEIAVDIHTNTIIVVATPEVQRIYASLIEKLDERRPQVLIEAQIVIIDTSDDYTLGVEVSGGDRTGGKRLFAFSSFGLSDVDPITGALEIIPGAGFNGTLVDPSTADVVVRAIANHRRARVVSTPRILVNDNAEGQLTSVIEVPFTSVNASQTVATTSFAGFAEAGTTITVTPTISDDRYLQVDYVVTLNSFTGAGSAGVPPPRQTNEVRSRVTVPDGYTVIVGGLKSHNGSYEINSIPWLERIPVVRELASLKTDANSETSLFVFLKPIILREDKFKDLKHLSDRDLHRAVLPAAYPVTAPLLMK